MRYNIYDQYPDDYQTVAENIELTEEEVQHYKDCGLIVVEAKEDK